MGFRASGILGVFGFRVLGFRALGVFRAFRVLRGLESSSFVWFQGVRV